MILEPIIKAKLNNFKSTYECSLSDDLAFERFVNWVLLQRHQPGAFTADFDLLADNYNVFVLGECGKLSSSFFATGINENLNFNNIPDGVYSLKIVGVNAHFEMWFSY